MTPSTRGSTQLSLVSPAMLPKNGTLIPASEFCNIDTCRERAKHLPDGELLVVVLEGKTTSDNREKDLPHA